MKQRSARAVALRLPFTEDPSRAVQAMGLLPAGGCGMKSPPARDLQGKVEGGSGVTSSHQVP